MEMVYVTGNEHRRPWSTILWRESFCREREGRGRSFCRVEEEVEAHLYVLAGLETMGSWKGIREEVSSWLYVSFYSGVRVREWKRRRSS